MWHQLASHSEGSQPRGVFLSFPCPKQGPPQSGCLSALETWSLLISSCPLHSSHTNVNCFHPCREVSCLQNPCSLKDFIPGQNFRGTTGGVSTRQWEKKFSSILCSHQTCRIPQCGLLPALNLPSAARAPCCTTIPTRGKTQRDKMQRER